MLNYPPASGGDVVMLSFIQAISKNWNVTVIFPGLKDRIQTQKLLSDHPRAGFVSLNEIDSWYQINAGVLQNTVDLLKIYFLKRQEYNSSEKYFYNSFFKIGDWIRSNDVRYDIIQVDFPWMLRIIDFLPGKSKKVFVNHEIQFVSNKRKQLKQSQELSDNFVFRQKKNEINYHNRYDACLTLSETDRQILTENGVTVKLYNSPLGIDLHSHKMLQHKHFDRLVFLGNGSHYPNLDAIDFFVTDILPLIKLKTNSIKLFITGKYDEEFKKKFINVQELVWAGYVNNLNEVMLNSISVIPIRIGSGIRIKILESMAAGCPVITTKTGIEGIDAQDGVEAFISNDNNTFAAHIVELFNDVSKCRSVAQNARLFVEENYNIERITNQRMQIYNKLLEEKK